MSQPVLTWHRSDLAVTVKMYVNPEGHDTVRVEADCDLLYESPDEQFIIMQALEIIVDVMADRSKLKPVISKPTYVISYGWERLAWNITLKFNQLTLEKLSHVQQTSLAT